MLSMCNNLHDITFIIETVKGAVEAQYYITKHFKSKMYTYWAMAEGWFRLKMTLCIRVLTTAAPSLLNFLIHGLSNSTTPTPNEHAWQITVVVASSVSPSVIGGDALSRDWRLFIGCLFLSLPPPALRPLCQKKLTGFGTEVNGERDFSWWTLTIDFVEHSCITIVMCVTYEISTNWLIIK